MGNLAVLETNFRLNGIKLKTNGKYSDSILKSSDLFLIKSDNNSFVLSYKVDKLPIDYSNRLAFSHQNLFKTLAIEAETSDLLNFSLNNRKIYLEFYPKNLKYIINNRKNLNKYFSESELILILKNMCEILLYFQNKNTNHGFMCIETVFYDSKSCNFKIYDFQMIIGYNKAYTEYINNNELLVINPELINSIQNNNLFLLLDEIKFDIFCLGILILQCANLIEQIETRSIKGLNKFIYENIEKMKINYSEQFINIIQGLLEFNVKNRLSPAEILELINNYKQNKQNESNSMLFNSFRTNRLSLSPIPIKQKKGIVPKFTYKYILKPKYLAHTQIIKPNCFTANYFINNNDEEIQKTYKYPYFSPKSVEKPGKDIDDTDVGELTENLDKMNNEISYILEKSSKIGL